MTKDYMKWSDGPNQYRFVLNTPANGVDLRGESVLGIAAKAACVAYAMHAALKFGKALADQYECCIKSEWKKVDLTSKNADGSDSGRSWSIPHKVMGCLTAKCGVGPGGLGILNIGNELGEFVKGEMKKFPSVRAYFKDTVGDIVDTYKGYGKGAFGAGSWDDCFTTFVPPNCRKVE